MTHKHPLTPPGDYSIHSTGAELGSIERAREAVENKGPLDQPPKLPKGITYQKEVPPSLTNLPDQDAQVPHIGKARRIKR